MNKILLGKKSNKRLTKKVLKNKKFRSQKNQDLKMNQGLKNDQDLKKIQDQINFRTNKVQV